MITRHLFVSSEDEGTWEWGRGWRGRRAGVGARSHRPPLTLPGGAFQGGIPELSPPPSVLQPKTPGRGSSAPGLVANVAPLNRTGLSADVQNEPSPALTGILWQTEGLRPFTVPETPVKIWAKNIGRPLERRSGGNPALQSSVLESKSTQARRGHR